MNNRGHCCSVRGLSCVRFWCKRIRSHVVFCTGDRYAGRFTTWRIDHNELICSRVSSGTTIRCRWQVGSAIIPSQPSRRWYRWCGSSGRWRRNDTWWRSSRWVTKGGICGECLQSAHIQAFADSKTHAERVDISPLLAFLQSRSTCS